MFLYRLCAQQTIARRMADSSKWQGLPLATASKAVLWLLGSALLWCQATPDFEGIKRSAHEGLATSQYILGSMYVQGRGVPRDDVEGARWFRKAADQGLAGAQTSLGAAYTDGQGVPQDYAEAVRWFRKAGDQSDADAQYLLGGMYEQGWGVPQDYVEAVRWYRKSADQGNKEGQFSLAACYFSGKGVPQDYVRAHMWLNLAASRENGDLQKKYSVFREKIAAVMTAEQVAEAQCLAREWKPTGK
jgi:TPR repeat protein